MKEFLKRLAKHITQFWYFIFTPFFLWILNEALADKVLSWLTNIGERTKAFDAVARLLTILIEHPVTSMVMIMLLAVLGGTIASWREVKKLHRDAIPKDLPPNNAKLSIHENLIPQPITHPPSYIEELYRQEASKRPNLIVPEVGFVEVWEVSEGGYSEFKNERQIFSLSAGIIRFENEPIKGKVTPATDVKAIIEFKEENGILTRIQTGCWLEEQYNYTSINIGESKALILFVYDPGGYSGDILAIDDRRSESSGKGLLKKRLKRRKYTINVKLVYDDDRQEYKITASLPDIIRIEKP